MSDDEAPRLISLLAAFQAGHVDLIVVGGVAALLHGAPITTFDLDIVPSLEEENLARLVAVLTSMSAVARDPAKRTLRPTASLFAAGGHVLLSTKLGPLDVLGRLVDGRGYEELLLHTVKLADGELEVRALDLPTLIEVKRRLGRAKDQLALPVLIALLVDQDGS